MHGAFELGLLCYADAAVLRHSYRLPERYLQDHFPTNGMRVLAGLIESFHSESGAAAKECVQSRFHAPDVLLCAKFNVSAVVTAWFGISKVWLNPS